jgi:hypothetical protein
MPERFARTRFRVAPAWMLKPCLFSPRLSNAQPNSAFDPMGQRLRVALNQRNDTRSVWTCHFLTGPAPSINPKKKNAAVGLASLRGHRAVAAWAGGVGIARSWAGRWWAVGIAPTRRASPAWPAWPACTMSCRVPRLVRLLRQRWESMTK